MAGAIEQQIGAEILCDVVGDGLDPVDHGIDDAVGEPRHRHRQGIDEFRLGLPFRRDDIGNLPGRRRQRAAGRRADRLVVQRDRKPARPLDDTGLGVKPLAARSARRAPHRLLRIEPGLPGHFIEQFAHAVFGLCLGRQIRPERTTWATANKANGLSNGEGCGADAGGNSVAAGRWRRLQAGSVLRGVG